jgi:hypothetical protein
MAEVVGTSTAVDTPGVRGESAQWNGIQGETTADGFAGVVGLAREGVNSHGVLGSSFKANGVLGVSAADGAAGVTGVNDVGDGPGLNGRSVRGAGVQGASTESTGVFGITTAAGHAGVTGINDSGGIGVLGRGRIAGRFEGDVEVTGDLSIPNADCAEEFDIAGDELIQPGTVMVLSDDGSLQPSQRAYDTRVAGVISGAGTYKPGIVLDKQATDGIRQAIALLGKVYCQVDADQASIAIGDMLTTSATPGHAMRATDPSRAFGAVIGKALGSLPSGRGLVPVLVALQ